MRYRSRREPTPEPLWRRLDRAAGEINPFLMVLAIGLGIFNLTCLVVLLIKLPITYISPCASVAPPSVTGSVDPGAAKEDAVREEERNMQGRL
jgi:hypothetical protein